MRVSHVLRPVSGSRGPGLGHPPSTARSEKSMALSRAPGPARRCDQDARRERGSVLRGMPLGEIHYVIRVKDKVVDRAKWS